jgi:hypothetical protein
VHVSIGVPDRTAPGADIEWHFPSARDPGTIHVVTLHADGSWSCTCPGFRYARRADTLCKNIDAALEADRPLTVAGVLCLEFG